MNASAHIVEIDESNAQQLLIDESMTRPVVVDFWADWCGPCKQLMPILEKLADEYQGAFLLAKVNADEQQMLASQLGVRSLPTVMVIKDGQPIDGFAGAQPESAVREVLQKHLPSPWDAKIAEATAMLDNDDANGAVALLRGVWEESNKLAEVTLAYAGALIEANRLDDAEAVLGEVRMVDQDALYEQLMAQIELKREAARSPGDRPNIAKYGDEGSVKQGKELSLIFRRNGVALANRGQHVQIKPFRLSVIPVTVGF